MQRYQNVIIDTAGAGIASVTISVYLAGTTTLASLFSDNGVAALGNPFLSDSDGSFNFYAADGRYDIKLAKTGYTFGTDLYDVQLFDLTSVSPVTMNPLYSPVVGTLTLSLSGGGVIQYTSSKILSGTGTPEGTVTSPIGSLFLRSDGGYGTSLYVKENGAGNTGWIPVKSFTFGILGGAFTLAGAASTVINNTAVGATSKIYVMPSNAAAATLMSGSKSLYHSANNGGVSFTVTTADGTNAAGTETFNYLLFV